METSAVSRREWLSLACASIAPISSAAEHAGGRVGSLIQRHREPAPSVLCFERARLMTAAYRKSEDQPAVLRRARAFQAVLEGIPTEIYPGELIVGNVSSRPKMAYFAPECFDWKGYIPEREYVLGDKRFSANLAISYKIPREVGDYWRDKPRGDHVGHFVADYAKVLREGFRGIQEEIQGHIAAGRNAAFYQAAEITCQAAEVFAARYAKRAREQAERETEARRRRELLRIAETCEKAPAAPAESFHEALQAFWFTHVLLHVNSPEWSISPGRFDQYMWPYYRRDVESGKLTRADAEELLACLWIKMNEVRVNSVDFINYQNLMIGGTDAEGRDVSNDLSYLCIDVTRRIPFVQPSLSLRWHPGTPKKLLEKAAECILAGTGRPALFNDLAIVPAFQDAGVALEDARDYAIAGCEEPSIPGKMFGVIRGLQINQARCVLSALTRFDRQADTRFEDILEAYRAEVKRASEGAIQSSLANDERNARHTPHPFASLLFDDCLAKGLDITEGGVRYNITSNVEAGTITAANSLLAVRKAVFEDRVTTIDELNEALRKNFDGFARLRAYLLHRVPKFGNDRDDIDLFARRVADFNHEVLAEINTRDYRGGRFFTGSGGSTAWLSGTTTGATPDGRLKGEALSVNLGPSAGTDRNGLTAMLNSVAKLNWRHQVGGALTPAKLPYTGSQNPASVAVLAALARGFFQKGGMGLHVTVVDLEMLKRALKEPDKHMDLMVRVGGFSAPFVLLSAEIQKNIIERVEQGLDSP